MDIHIAVQLDRIEFNLDIEVFQTKVNITNLVELTNVELGEILVIEELVREGLEGSSSHIVLRVNSVVAEAVGPSGLHTIGIEDAIELVVDVGNEAGQRNGLLSVAEVTQQLAEVALQTGLDIDLHILHLGGIKSSLSYIEAIGSGTGVTEGEHLVGLLQVGEYDARLLVLAVDKLEGSASEINAGGVHREIEVTSIAGIGIHHSSAIGNSEGNGVGQCGSIGFGENHLVVVLIAGLAINGGEQAVTTFSISIVSHQHVRADVERQSEASEDGVLGSLNDDTGNHLLESILQTVHARGEQVDLGGVCVHLSAQGLNLAVQSLKAVTDNLVRSLDSFDAALQFCEGQVGAIHTVVQI